MRKYSYVEEGNCKFQLSHFPSNSFFCGHEKEGAEAGALLPLKPWMPLIQRTSTVHHSPSSVASQYTQEPGWQCFLAFAILVTPFTEWNSTSLKILLTVSIISLLESLRSTRKDDVTMGLRKAWHWNSISPHLLYAIHTFWVHSVGGHRRDLTSSTVDTYSVLLCMGIGK